MVKGGKRRHWSEDEKRMICAQTRVPGVSVSQVARRYNVNANQVFNWLKDARYSGGLEDTDVAQFLPVEVVVDPGPVKEAVVAAADSTSAHDRSGCEGHIEIEIGSGSRIVVTGSFDPDFVIQLVHGLSS